MTDKNFRGMLSNDDGLRPPEVKQVGPYRQVRDPVTGERITPMDNAEREQLRRKRRAEAQRHDAAIEDDPWAASKWD